MGDASIDALSSPSYAHYRTDGGCIVVQMGDASATLGEHTTTDVVIVCYNLCFAGASGKGSTPSS